MERYVRDFYAQLARGVLPGQRCLRCGQTRLTYVAVCDRCKGRELEAVALRPHGTLTLFSVRQPWDMPRLKRAEPLAMGEVELDDGPVLWCCVDKIDISDPQKDWYRLPLEVDIEIRQLYGNPVPVAVVCQQQNHLEE